MMTLTKKSISWILAGISIMLMVVATFAYFTDRVATKTTYKTADASEIIKVTPDGTEEGSEDPGATLESLWKANNPDEIIEPGDEVDLNYELTNIGSADIDVKETFILTSTVDLDQATPEYRLFLNSFADKYGAMVGGTVVSSETISKNQAKYELAPFSLEKGQSKKFDYIMVFNKYATNKFQESVCTIDYLVELRQHAKIMDVNDGWEEIQSATIQFGGNGAYKVVPEA